MERSYNGWSASPNAGDIGIVTIEPVPGRKFNVASTAAPLFDYFIRRFHSEVEPIDQGIFDDWSYNYRKNRNSNNLSCHASGTAVDLNATKHPNGKRDTFTPDQVVKIERILADLKGALTWGRPGSKYGWTMGSRPDEMHIEVTAKPDDSRVMAGLIVANTNEVDDLDANQSQKLDAVYTFLMEQQRPEGQGYSWSHANANKLDEVLKFLQGPDNRWDQLTQVMSWMPEITKRLDVIESKLADDS